MPEFVFLEKWRSFGVVAGFSSREGGVSRSSYASMNLGLHVSDDARAVLDNRRKIAKILARPVESFCYAQQVHGSKVAIIREKDLGCGSRAYDTAAADADGLATVLQGAVLSILAADCVPVLFADPKARVVAAAHAGWRGATGGVVSATVRAMMQLGARKERIHVAFGPAIRGCCYEVDEPVLQAVTKATDSRRQIQSQCVLPSVRGAGYGMLDIPTLCREELQNFGLDPKLMTDVSICTNCMPGFYSYRRDHGVTGRHGGFIYMAEV